MNERNKLKKIVILMVAGVLLCTFVMAMDIFTPSSTTTGSPAAIERTYIANGTQNVTVTGDAAFIIGYSAGIDLYVTLPTNVSGPMITPFEVNVTAYGQAVESFYVGRALYSSSQFTGNIIIHDNVTYSGNVNLTLRITSPQGTVTFKWLPYFMSPVQYIKYENAKQSALIPGLSTEDVAAIGVTIILAAVAFFKLFYPAAKLHVRKQWIKEGPKRHV